ncbi:histidine kinase [Pedobacter mendelii]|nr:sensor histidine kinase [Pedobacter mendelii]
MLKNYQVHIIAWTAFIFWESVIIGLIYGRFGNFSNYAIHYAVNICIFYLHAYVLQQGFKNPKQAFWKLPLFIISETVVYVSFIYGMDSLLIKYTQVISHAIGNPFQQVLTVLWRCLFFIFFGTGYYFLIRFLSIKLEKERVDKQRFKILLEKEKMEKELALSKNAFLKAQINPHLLFNTLEFVYQRFKYHSPKDAEAILHLADIMRYAASTEDTGEFISLAEEIQQCENLILLYKLTNTNTYINLAYATDINKIKIIPLILITVLENMFKHGNLTSPANSASLDIFVNKNELIISSRNKTSLTKPNYGLNAGLNNIKNRLAFTYGNNSSLEYFTDEDNFFTLTITISCKVLSYNGSSNLVSAN